MRRIRNTMITVALSAGALALGFLIRSAAGEGGTGSISGVVDNGQDPLLAEVILFDSQDEVVCSTWTSLETGEYNIAEVAPGTYTAHVSFTDYVTQERPVTITAAQNTVESFTLVPQATIAGRVTKSDGTTPVSALGLLAVPTTDLDMGVGNTDENGNYLIKGLAAGTYLVRSCTSDYLLTTQEVSLSAGQNLTGVNLTAQNGGITGKVTEANGTTGLEGAVVYLFQGEDLLKAAFTDTSGDYALAPVASGTYRLQATVEANTFGEIPSVAVTDGQTTASQNFSAPGGSISGTVQATGDPGDPISGAAVRAIASTGPGAGSLTDATTDTNGNYTLGRLPAGDYLLMASKDGFAADVLNNVTVVGTQNTPAQNFSLVFGGNVSGTVTKVPDNSPVQGARIICVPTIACADDIYDAGVTDANGQYTVSGLTPDSYHVIAQADGYRSDSLESVTVTAGQTTGNQNFSLSTTGGSVSGTVYESDGTTPIPGALVLCGAPALSWATTTTDANGQYVLGLLEDGSYVVTAYGEGFAPGVLGNITVVGVQENSGNNFLLSSQE